MEPEAQERYEPSRSIRIIKTAGLKKKENARVRHPTIVLTIGHSTRAIEEFISLLQAHAVSRVADVRTVPRSRHNPQFDQDSLPNSLKKAGLGYVHMPRLGGLRHTKRDSLNVGWRNPSFRGYADYMQTPEFEQSLEELIQLAKQERIAIMVARRVARRVASKYFDIPAEVSLSLSEWRRPDRIQRLRFALLVLARR
jgi:Domain of unknown function DUF488